MSLLHPMSWLQTHSVLRSFLSRFVSRIRLTWKRHAWFEREIKEGEGGGREARSDDISVDFLAEDLAVEGSQWKVDKRAALR